MFGFCLVPQLLQFNPMERLGAGVGGVDDIKSHPFFARVEWHKQTLCIVGLREPELGRLAVLNESFQTGQTYSHTVNTNLAFLHTSVLWTFINHVLFFSWNLPISSITFPVDRSLLYPIEGVTFLCREYVWCNNLYSKCGY